MGSTLGGRSPACSYPVTHGARVEHRCAPGTTRTSGTACTAVSGSPAGSSGAAGSGTCLRCRCCAAGYRIPACSRVSPRRLAAASAQRNVGISAMPPNPPSLPATAPPAPITGPSMQSNPLNLAHPLHWGQRRSRRLRLSKAASSGPPAPPIAAAYSAAIQVDRAPIPPSVAPPVRPVMLGQTAQLADIDGACSDGQDGNEAEALCSRTIRRSSVESAHRCRLRGSDVNRHRRAAQARLVLP